MLRKSIIIFLICFASFSVTFAMYPITAETKKFLLYNWHEKHWRGIDELETIWEVYSSQQYEEAIFRLTLLIDDPEGDKYERFHFLVARSVFCLALDDIDMHKADAEEIIKMIKSDDRIEFIYFVFYRKLYYYQSRFEY